MRSFRHWTPRYLRDRIGLWFYERNHSDHPWLTQAANAILSSLIRPTDIGFEWGAGRSTLWFAKHSRRLTSIEHDEAWYRRVKGMTEENGLENVDLRLCSTQGGEHSSYVSAVTSCEPASLDFALVDGRLREHCMSAVLDRIRPGGLLVLDNANRYIPNDSRSPGSARAFPNPQWQDVAEALASWRRIWTSNGVSDTAIWIKE